MSHYVRPKHEGFANTEFVHVTDIKPMAPSDNRVSFISDWITLA